MTGVKMRKALIMRRVRVGLVACVLSVALAVAPVSAYGWSNGPGGDGFGTHDWVVYKANQIAVGRGATWVNINTAMAASDDPDMVFHDTYYHCYDIWGSTYGNSPLKIAECYNNAVASLKAGDTNTASYYVGLLSHYYSDTCNPLHTDQVADEDRMHSSYESAVDDTTLSTGSLSGWVVDDGYVHVDDPAGLARDAAMVAHADYSLLVNAYISSGLSAVQGVTRAHLNQASNDIADLIKSISDEANPFVAVPNAVYRFYNLSNGTHFYTPSADEALTVMARWSNVYQYEGISYFADPAKNTQPLYRFYNNRTGSHFYTASLDEANTVIARWSSIYAFEGQTYSVCPTPVAGGAAIYRFYNLKNGSHFYTASAEEANTVIARWSSTYQWEGPAFWVVP